MAASLTAPKIITVPTVNTGTRVGRNRTVRVTVGAAITSDVQVDAQGTYQVLSVPAGAVIVAVRTRIITAFSASVTIGIGDGNGTSGFLQTADVAPTSAETAGIYINSITKARTYAGGLKYLAADTIDAIIGGATPAVGLMELLIEFLDGTCGVA